MCAGKAGAVFQTVFVTVLYFKPNGSAASGKSRTRKGLICFRTWKGFGSCQSIHPRGSYKCNFNSVILRTRKNPILALQSMMTKLLYTNIDLAPLMPDEDKNFGVCLVLDFSRTFFGIRIFGV